jgi:hypothetical protein
MLLPQVNWRNATNERRRETLEAAAAFAAPK